MSGDERATRVRIEDEPDPSAGSSLRRVGLVAVNRWGPNFDCRCGCRSRFEGSLRDVEAVNSCDG